MRNENPRVVGDKRRKGFGMRFTKQSVAVGAVLSVATSLMVAPVNASTPETNPLPGNHDSVRQEASEVVQRSGVTPRRMLAPHSQVVTLYAKHTGKRINVKINGVRGSATIFWKVGKKNRKKSKRFKSWKQTWSFNIPKNAKNIRADGPGMAPLAVKRPKRKNNYWWQRTDSFTPIPANAGPASAYNLDWDFGDRYRHDPCVYETGPDPEFGWTTIVTKATPNRTTLTWSLRTSSGAKEIRAAIKKIQPYVDWRLKEVPYTTGADIRFTPVKWKNGTEMDGYAEPDNATHLYNPKKQRFNWMNIHLNLSKKATSDMNQRLILHEAGHALGLGHMNNHYQVMQEGSPWGAPAVLGKGDRAGLKQIGYNKGCVFKVGDEYPEFY